MSETIDTSKIQDDINYFMSKINVGASFFDARCFQIMNENFGLKPLFEEALLKSCEWINTNDEMPKAGQIVFAYMENDVELGEKVFEFHDVIRAVYYPKFHMECDGNFDGDCDYDEAKDEYYWPEGWYEWNSVEDTHWMATKKAKLWMHIPVPKAQS